MQNTSALYRQLYALQNHWFETKVNINGVDYFEDQLFAVSTSSRLFARNPDVGKAVAGEINVTLIDPAEDIPVMAVVRPYVRVCGYIVAAEQPRVIGGIVYLTDASSIDGEDIATLDGAAINSNIVYYPNITELQESEWLPKGVYYIDTRQTSHNDDGVTLMELHGYDAMLKAEQYWGDDMMPSGGWPDDGLTDIQVVQMIAEKMGVAVDSRTVSDMDGGYKIPMPIGYTLREVLGYLAAPYLGCFIITEQGKLRMVSILDLPPETNYLIDNAGYAITFGGTRILV
jgi:hypothetical protein